MRELYARIILGILIAHGILRKYFILCRKVISYSYIATPVFSYSYIATPVFSYSYIATPVFSYSYIATPVFSYSYIATPVFSYSYIATPVFSYLATMCLLLYTIEIITINNTKFDYVLFVHDSMRAYIAS